MSLARLLFRPLAGPPQLLTVSPDLRVGRGPHNDLVLPNGDVSWSHALFRWAGREMFVEDLGSRNGTFVAGIRIERPTALGLGVEVRLGDAVFVRKDEGHLTVQHTLMLEDVASRVRYPLHPPHFTIGGAAGDLQIPDVEPVILVFDGHTVSLNGESLAVPWSGEVGGRTLRILAVQTNWTPTLERALDGPVRQLRIALDPPQAKIFELPSCASHTITAEHRVSLLYFLASALQDDLDQGLEADRCGWRSDASISVAVWGRAGLESSRNRLNALTYRLRQELGDNGVSADLIEKKQGWARLVPCEVVLDVE
ncbi:MAG: FHA domain-containing protein [Alphaproteobacteria bacterium]|nr:FHA domain-containing protein [Alphaproteobacteria bacterium]